MGSSEDCNERSGEAVEGAESRVKTRPHDTRWCSNSRDNGTTQRSKQMQIIDSHCHFVEPPRPDRPHDPKWASNKPPLPVEELLEAAEAAGVTKLVQVTSIVMGDDNRYSFESAERYPDR